MQFMLELILSNKNLIDFFINLLQFKFQHKIKPRRATIKNKEELLLRIKFKILIPKKVN